MEILRGNPDGGFDLVGKRCDRCRHEARACSALEEEFEMYEYVRVAVNAGYGASYFADGDSWAVDLCERCVHELLAPYMRMVWSNERREVACRVDISQETFGDD